MSTANAFLISFTLCGLAAALEGLCAGRNVKSFFQTLKFPPYSAPLWIWSIIGGLYYVIFWFVTYRLLRLADSGLRKTAFALVVFMMLVNALSNYIIFRARNLRHSLIVGGLFPFMDIALFICLVQLDTIAAWSLIPYLLYRIYAIWWAYGLWKLNS